MQLGKNAAGSHFLGRCEPSSVVGRPPLTGGALPPGTPFIGPPVIVGRRFYVSRSLLSDWLTASKCNIALIHVLYRPSGTLILVVQAYWHINFIVQAYWHLIFNCTGPRAYLSLWGPLIFTQVYLTPFLLNGLIDTLEFWK